MPLLASHPPKKVKASKAIFKDLLAPLVSLKYGRSFGALTEPRGVYVKGVG